MKLLPRDGYTPPKTTLECKNRRAPFSLRSSAAAVDIACGVSFAALLGAQGTSMQMVIIAYYMATEFIAGQTFGKMMFGIELVRPNQPLTVQKVAVRCILRAIGIAIPPLGLVLMLSWKRVTLLDRLTGLRVVLPDSAFENRARRKKTAPNFEEELLQR